MTDRASMAISFEQMAADNRAAVVRYLGRLVGEADAEDVAQIALTKAAAGLEGFRGEASPKNWLFRIATHAALDWLRSHGTQSNVPMPAEDEAGAELLGEEASQERRLVREEMSTCVRGVLQRLPEGHQTILALSDCDELSDRDIAAVLGLTVGAAKVRLHRARARLKTELERDCSFYRDTDNVLCCDKKQETGSTDTERNSAAAPYLSSHEPRHQVESRTERGPTETPDQELDMTNETLPTKQKHLIGVGASIAAGCQPCTKSFVAAAHAAGACERGARHALETGLRSRAATLASMQAFADETFAKPDLDEAFLADRKVLEALIGVAAALAGNAADVLTARVEQARQLGATDAQIKLAGQIGVTARQGATKEADASFAKALGGGADAGCCEKPGKDCAAGGCAEPASKPAASPCGCAEPVSEPAASPCGCSPAPGQ